MDASPVEKPKLQLVRTVDPLFLSNCPSAFSYWTSIKIAEEVINEPRAKLFSIPSMKLMCDSELKCLLDDVKNGEFSGYEESQDVQDMIASLKQAITRLEELAAKYKIRIVDDLSGEYSKNKMLIRQQFAECTLLPPYTDDIEGNNLRIDRLSLKSDAGSL